MELSAHAALRPVKTEKPDFYKSGFFV